MPIETAEPTLRTEDRAAENVSDLCVIFDLDGTLVDSEPLCNRAFLDLLPRLQLPLETLIARYRGRKLAEILRDLEQLIGEPLPPDFERRYRLRVEQLFSEGLQASPGAPQMLGSLPYVKCVASSGPRQKIEQALQIAGLASHFEGRIFSAYEVGSWKPDPGLFLYAARQMGVAPRRCVVIEDSEVGIEAARRAGMRSLLYAPQGCPGSDNTFASMHDLAGILGALAKTAWTGL